VIISSKTEREQYRGSQRASCDVNYQEAAACYTEMSSGDRTSANLGVAKHVYTGSWTVPRYE